MRFPLDATVRNAIGREGTVIAVGVIDGEEMVRVEYVDSVNPGRRSADGIGWTLVPGTHTTKLWELADDLEAV